MKHLIFKKSFYTTVVAIAMLITACSNQRSKAQNKSTQTQTKKSKASGKQLVDAPDFTLKKMDGTSYTLSDHQGQVIVLNVWATWCPPCRKEIPDFIKIQKEMRDEGVLFVGVSEDKEGWEVVKPFAKKYGINYPLIVDDGTIRQKYGPFRGIPTTFIITKKGKVAYAGTGMVQGDGLKAALKKLAER